MGCRKMGNKRFDPRRLKSHLQYTVEEIAKALGCHRQTVWQWIKLGMPVADSRRPLLIYGGDAKAYLKSRYSAQKTTLAPGEMYCLRCRAGRRPAFNVADLIPTTADLGSLQGLCEVCSTVMNVRVSISTWRAAAGALDVEFKQPQGSLVDSSEASLKLNFAQWMQGA
jgi:hypothetical protein